jgi:hypothetical protein
MRAEPPILLMFEPRGAGVSAGSRAVAAGAWPPFAAGRARATTCGAMRVVAAASDAAGEPRRRVADRVAAGLDAAGDAVRETRVAVDGDDEVSPVAGRVELPGRFGLVAGAYRDRPRGTGAVIVAAARAVAVLVAVAMAAIVAGTACRTAARGPGSTSR